MKLATIIATLNRPDFLRKCLKSILEQKIKPNKIYLVNNNKLSNVNKSIYQEFNNDLSLEYINDYESIHVIRNNVALNLNYDLVSFLDDDDLWHPDYIAKSLQIISDKNLDVLYTSMEVKNEFNQKISEINLKPNYENSELFIYNPGFLTSNLIVRTEVFQKLKGFASRNGSADKDFILRVLKNNFKYYINPERLVIRTEHSSQFSKDYIVIFYEKVKFLFNNYKEMSYNQIVLYINYLALIFLKFLKKLLSSK
jgi:GT2 family glycosyltransferase